MKITIFGCGKMGGGIAERLAKNNEVYLFDRNKERTKHFAKEIHAFFCQDPLEALSNAEILILAIKPQDLKELAKLIHSKMHKNQLIVSVLAGTSTSDLQSCFAGIPILRIMPNTAVRYGQGVVGAEIREDFPKELQRKAEKALSSLGLIHWIPKNKFDAITALTGSGPAFVFILIESMIDAAIAMGFSAEEAKKLTFHLFQGALSLIKESGKHPGELKWDVTSPGGTTIAGVKTMEDKGVRSGIINTFLAAYERTKELSREKN